MKHIQRLALFAALLPSYLKGGDHETLISYSAGQVLIDYSAEEGRSYEIWASSDLSPDGWSGPLDTRTGTGAVESVSFNISGHPKRFFQLRVSDLAPTANGFEDVVVGKTLPNTEIQFTSSNRFKWREYAGYWVYTKTGPNTALIVFTYDEDNNNANLYREEAVLTFTGKVTGNFDYCEYYSNVCDPGSIITDAPFDLE